MESAYVFRDIIMWVVVAVALVVFGVVVVLVVFLCLYTAWLGHADVAAFD